MWAPPGTSARGQPGAIGVGGCLSGHRSRATLLVMAWVRLHVPAAVIWRWTARRGAHGVGIPREVAPGPGEAARRAAYRPAQGSRRSAVEALGERWRTARSSEGSSRAVRVACTSTCLRRFQVRRRVHGQTEDAEEWLDDQSTNHPESARAPISDSRCGGRAPRELASDRKSVV